MLYMQKGSISNGRNYSLRVFNLNKLCTSAEPQMDVQLSIDQITISQDICFSNAKLLITNLSLIIRKNLCKFAICEMWKQLFFVFS